MADAAKSAPAFRSPTPDTLLPGALPRPDHLLPRATRSKPVLPAATPARGATRTRADARTRARAIVRAHWRRVVVLVVVTVALVMSVVAAWPVVFGTDAAPVAARATPEARATALLRTVVGGGRALFATSHSFARVSPSTLSAHSYKVPIVASARVARVGQVSMRVNSAKVLTLATPAEAQRCVFARDEPGQSGTRFVTVRTPDCRAGAAPAEGWSLR
jgi:hypothetical protein